MSATSRTRSSKVKPQLSCPHCWQVFPTDQILFISESPDLPPDPKLPRDRLRFLPQQLSSMNLVIPKVQKRQKLYVSKKK